MSIDTEVSYLLNQLDDLKKRVYKMQQSERKMKKVAGYGLGIGRTGLAIGIILVIKHIKEGP